MIPIYKLTRDNIGLDTGIDDLSEQRGVDDSSQNLTSVVMIDCNVYCVLSHIF
jgi:hypothetical protein